MIEQAIEWWNAHGLATVAAVVALVLAAEGVVRALEVVVDSLRGLAALTSTTKDDVAIGKAAKWLHGIANVLATVKGQVARLGVRGKS